jgi:hypothetical protein
MFLIGLDLPEINNAAFSKMTLLKHVGVFAAGEVTNVRPRREE